MGEGQPECALTVANAGEPGQIGTVANALGWYNLCGSTLLPKYVTCTVTKNSK